MRSRALHRTLLAAAALVGTVVAGWFAVRNVDLDVFWEALRTSDYWWLAPATAVLLAAAVLRAQRWRLTFRRETRPPLGATTRALLIGQLFNVVLPARVGGEAVRIVVLHQAARTSRAEALGTAVVERLYDLLALLFLLLLATPFLPDVTWIRRAGVAAVIALAAVVALAAATLRYGSRPVALLLRPVSWLPWFSREDVEAVARNVTQGFGALQRPGLAFPVFAITVVSWLAIALSFWFALIGFDLGLGFGAALLVVVATSFALVLPSLPASVGVFEAATLVALRPYGIDDSRAISCAVVVHALTIFPYVFVGAILLHQHAQQTGRKLTERSAQTVLQPTILENDASETRQRRKSPSL
jgi:glycosyltransferase 2 family protein